MNSGKMICLIDCSWVYPPPYRKFALCRVQTVTNTWTLLKTSWRESTTNTLFFSVLLGKLNLKLLPTTTRVLPMPTFPCLYRELWEEFKLKGTEGKAIFCTSPRSDSKLNSGKLWMQPQFITWLGLDHSFWTSQLAQLDISQFRIMTLIHWISLRYFIQIKSSAFQSSAFQSSQHLSAQTCQHPVCISITFPS